jgi:hypothetical protein
LTRTAASEDAIQRAASDAHSSITRPSAACHPRKLDRPGGAGGDDLGRCAPCCFVRRSAGALGELTRDLERDLEAVATYAEVDEIEAAWHSVNCEGGEPA